VTTKVKVRKGVGGIWFWNCKSESCRHTTNAGASIHWEIAQHGADEHVREHHKPASHLGRDIPTPPGGQHYDWSDTGMHVRIREDE
jgi:hypothetical protein